MLVDYHMHLRPDGERLDPAAFARDHIAEYVAMAIARGVEEIAFTEHVHRFAAARGVFDHPFWVASALDDLAAYHDGVAAARASGLPVLVGLELDWLAGSEAPLVALAEAHRWDIVLGSVHWLDGLAVDHPHYSIFDLYPVEHVWERYVDEFCAAATSGIYDVMAHPDLAKVFGRRPPEPILRRLHDRMADALASATVAFEISTAGLRKEAAELYPAQGLLDRLRRAGVPVTLASDAHLPEDVGRDFDRAVRALRDAGYRSIVRFRGRDRQLVELG